MSFRLSSVAAAAHAVSVGELVDGALHPGTHRVSGSPIGRLLLSVATPVTTADSSAQISGARATFASENEVFRLYDTACDNRPVYLRFDVNGGATQFRRHSGGCNTNSTLNESFAEGARVSYRACVGTPESTVRCSTTTDDIA